MQMKKSLLVVAISVSSLTGFLLASGAGVPVRRILP